jgi:hypothetical protein
MCIVRGLWMKGVRGVDGVLGESCSASTRWRRRRQHMNMPKSVKATDARNVPTIIGTMNFIFICLSAGSLDGGGDDVASSGLVDEDIGVLVAAAAIVVGSDVELEEVVIELVDVLASLLGQCLTFLAIERVIN